MYIIVIRKSLNPTVTQLEIEAPLVANKAKPGQFIILRVDENGERIPLTVAGVNKENGTVKGLNTAATLWCTAAIGLLSSSGMYSYAFIATFILLMANVIFRPLSQKIDPLDNFNEDESFYKINIVCHETEELKIRSEILKETKKTKLTLTELDTKELENNKVQIEATYRFIGQRIDDTIEGLVSTLSIKHGIKKVGWEII